MKTVLIVLLLAVSANAQSFKFYWHDRWDSHEPGLFYFDKLDHLAANAAGFWTLKKVGIESPRDRFLIVTGLSIGWEIRDGFRWKKTGGFSFHDLAAGMAGQIIVFGAEQLFDKPKAKKYDEALRKASEATLRLSTDGVSIPCPDGIAGCAVNHVILKSGVKDASSN